MKNYITLLLSFFPLLFTLAQNKQSDNKEQIENIRKQLKEINQNINERKGDPKQQEMRLFQIKKNRKSSIMIGELSKVVRLS